MANIRATFMFKNDNGAGWSETIFSTQIAIPLAMVNAKLMIAPRVGMLGRGSSLAFIRVSDDDVKRDSLIYAVPDGDGRPKSRQIQTADIAHTCLLLRIESGFTKRRSLFVRGVPDNICADNGRYEPDPAFSAAYNIWRVAMLGLSWGIKIRGDAAAPVNISNVSTVGPTGLVTITTAAAHGLVQNDVVNIRQVLGAVQVRGLQKVVSVVDATNFTIRVSRVVKPYLGAGNVTKNSYSVVALSNIDPIRCSHHNAGRPFDSPVGRRRVL